MENEAQYEVAEESTEESRNLPLAVDRPKQALIVTPDELDPELLKPYLTSWKQGGADIVSFSARGIEHLSQLLGLSIVETNFEETKDGKGFYITAVSENLQTGQRATSVVEQSKANRRGSVDPDALSKGFTRAQRNAHSKLLPIEMLKRRVLEAVKEGSAPPPLVQAQTECRTQLRKVSQGLKEVYDLSPAEAFEFAQTNLGSSEEWSEDEWKQFTAVLRNLQGEEAKQFFRAETV